jgi:heptosyltransferase-3
MLDFTPQRILVIQLRRIGDVLMCTPAVRSLRKNFPKAFMAFLTEKESAAILSENPYLDELIALDRKKYKNPWYSLKSLWKVRKKKFDLVIDFFGNPRSAYFSFFSGAKVRLGYTFHQRKMFYNLIAYVNSTPQYAALARLEALSLIGIKEADCRLDFFLSKEAQKFAESFFIQENVDSSKLSISVSPTSRRAFNRYPLERYAQICDWLVSKYNAEIILVWGPKEKEVVEKLSALISHKPKMSRETSSLQELGAILKKCDIHLGNDNGTKHIAVAMGKPTLTIYGPHSEISWTYPDFSLHKFVKKKVICPDCEKIKHSCEKLDCLDIPVAEIQGVWKELIKSVLDKGEEKVGTKIKNFANS